MKKHDGHYSLDELFGEGKDDDSPISSRTVLATVSTSRALRDKMSEIERSCGLVVVRVPSLQWSLEVVHALRRSFPEHNIRQEPTAIGKDSAREMLVSVSKGQAPFVVTTYPTDAFPPALRAAIASEVVIEEPTIGLLVEVGTKLFAGQVKRYFKDLSIDGLDFDTIGACLIPGETAAKAARRLKAAASPKQVVHEIGHVPTLEQARGFGEALSWARDLCRDIADYEAGKLQWREVDHGAVLCGAPGVGKSLFARITAKAAGISLMPLSIADLLQHRSGHLDDVLKGLRNAFSEAASQAPCLLFIDEVDALPKRGTGGLNENWWRPITNDFLMLLDSAVSDREGVVVVLATNRIDDIDSALLRPGRMDKILHIAPPDPDSLLEILRYHLDGQLADVDLSPLLGGLSGKTGADAAQWVKAARRRARASSREIELEDLLHVVIGIDERPSSILRRVAIHEAGHAVAALAMGFEVSGISILSDRDSHGSTYLDAWHHGILTRSQLECIVVTLLAGRAAEEVILGKDFSTAAGGGPNSDLALATQQIAVWFSEFGLGETLSWRSMQGALSTFDLKLAQEIEAELRRLYSIAQGVVITHRDSVTALSGELLSAKALDAARVRKVVGQLPPPLMPTVS